MPDARLPLLLTLLVAAPALAGEPAELTLGDACLTTNPRPASAAEIEAMLRAAL